MKPIILLGMHRSGTSLLARILSELGIYMGNDVNIHHESKYFLKANENILSICHTDWDYPRQVEYLYEDNISFENTFHHFEKEINSLNFQKEYIGRYNRLLKPQLNKDYKWGWKEPRTTITFPIWSKIFPDAKFIYLYRNGIDVAASLYYREINRRGVIHSKPYSLRCLNLDRAFELWEEYNTFFFENMNYIPPDNLIIISYEEFLKEPQKIVGRINNFIKLTVDNEKVKDICKTIKSDNAFKFLESDLLMTIYSRYCNTPMMKKMNYNNIKKRGKYDK